MYLVALAQYSANETESVFATPKVLLIDADTETPGITWWAREKITQPQYSYLDLLACLSEDIDNIDNIIKEATDKIKTMRLELGSERKTVFYLPAFRNVNQIMRPPVSPESITLATNYPWLLGDLLLKLGKSLQVNHIFIDLHAGMSKLSGPLFYDPRVHRILVTTTSEQSVRGSLEVLKKLNHVSSIVCNESRNNYAKNTKILINFVPKDTKDSTLMPNIIERFSSEIDHLKSDFRQSDTDICSWLFQAGYDQTLLCLGCLDNALVAMEQSAIVREICSGMWNEFSTINDENRKYIC